jgi:hypothetical protein
MLNSRYGRHWIPPNLSRWLIDALTDAPQDAGWINDHELADTHGLSAGGSALTSHLETNPSAEHRATKPRRPRQAKGEVLGRYERLDFDRFELALSCFHVLRQ